MLSNASFTADALLFDMDGTLVNSTAGVVGAWTEFAKTYPNIDVENILSSSHGVRTVENLKKWCGINDPEELEKEAERFEAAIVSSSTEEGRPGLLKLPGVTEIFEQIEVSKSLSESRWTICTSATNIYCSGALKATGIPKPEALVVAEDVEKGKPFPDPYLLGAKRLGVKPESCVVFEDAPAGVQSGKAAGCKTIGLLTTHPRQQMENARPDFLVKDLSEVFVKFSPNGVEVTVGAQLPN